MRVWVPFASSWSPWHKKRANRMGMAEYLMSQLELTLLLSARTEADKELIWVKAIDLLQEREIDGLEKLLQSVSDDEESVKRDI
jgi:hypothetical protein